MQHQFLSCRLPGMSSINNRHHRLGNTDYVIINTCTTADHIDDRHKLIKRQRLINLHFRNVFLHYRITGSTMPFLVI